jgi:hypothetical protein
MFFLPQNFVSNDSAAFLFKRSRRIQMTFPLGESQLYFENLTFKGTAAANSSRNQTRAGLPLFLLHNNAGDDDS